MHVFDSATIAQLLDWCSNHGVYIDSRLEIKESEDSEAGITVFSREPITNRTALVRISKTAVLSVKSCSSSAQIPPEPYGLGAHLALSLAVYTEILLAENSDWFGYLDSLPRELVDLALFWGVDGILDAHVDESTIVDETSDGLRLIDGKEALSWLTGTELEKELRASPETGQNVVDEIRAYYFSTAEPVVSRLLSSEKPTPPPTMSGFFHAYSLVSSRAFLVDAYHGLAMVPIADVFNHTQENHIHLESDNDVCVVCGSLEECPHDSDANDKDVRSPSGNAIGEGHSASVIAHSRQAKAEDTCDMVSNAPIFAHREVFNTYGEKLTNAALLARYGFALDSNENDCITWDWDDTRTFAAEVLERDSSGRGSRLGPDAFMQLYSQAVELWHAHENSPLAETSLVYRPETDTASTVRTLKDGGGGEHDAGGRALSNAVLCVNGDGKMSDELWLYCALLGAMGNLEIEDMVVHLREVARLLWQLETQMDIEGSDGKCSSDGGSIDGGRRGEGSADQERIQAVVNPLTPIGGLVLDTIRTVLCLCCSRRQSIGKADLQQAGDVGDALDRIPPHMTRTRKAMTEVLSEKSLLESVESSWTSLLDYIS